MRAPRRVSDIINVTEGDVIQLIEIISSSFGNVPISYQAIYVPPDADPIELWSKPDSKQYKNGFI